MSKTDTAEDVPYGKQWSLPPLVVIINSFLGPFVFFMCIMSLSQFTNLKWDNGSFGAASVILFSLPHSSASIPRHMYFGQIVSALIGFLSLYALQSQSLLFLRVSLAVASSTMLMKMTGISYPPGGATSFIIATTHISQWTLGKMALYLVFPLLTATTLLIAISVIFNDFLLKEKYPKFIL